MPFLQAEELVKHIPVNWAESILQETQSFQEAEHAAALRVTAITGQTVPEDANDAPDWTKQPVAFMVLYARIGFLNPTREQMEWAGTLNRQALDDLERFKLSKPTGRTGSSVTKIDGLNEL